MGSQKEHIIITPSPQRQILEARLTNTMKTRFIFFLLLLFFFGSALAWGAKGGQKNPKERNEPKEVNEKLTESLEVEQRQWLEKSNVGNSKEISREAPEEDRGMRKKKKKKRRN